LLCVCAMSVSAINCVFPQPAGAVMEPRSIAKRSISGAHVLRIGETAALMAEAIGMPQRWCELIRLAAPMHDLGKIGIPDRILHKEGPLTVPERQQMMEHPRIGHAILQDAHATDLTDMAADIAYGHHEKWDGSGYPQGLAGKDIPLSARIVALCDVYDALRMERPYKRAWSPERAQAYILEQSGVHFDPELVTVMRRCFGPVEQLIEDDAELAGIHKQRQADAGTGQPPH